MYNKRKERRNVIHLIPVVATDVFHPEQAEKEIREFMDLTDDTMHVELIFKDISTVRRDPKRLWEWETIAMRTAEDYAK